MVIAGYQSIANENLAALINAWKANAGRVLKSYVGLSENVLFEPPAEFSGIDRQRHLLLTRVTLKNRLIIAWPDIL